MRQSCFMSYTYLPPHINALIRKTHTIPRWCHFGQSHFGQTRLLKYIFMSKNSIYIKYFIYILFLELFFHLKNEFDQFDFDQNDTLAVCLHTLFLP